jgi:hypothetical protein
LVPAKRCSTFQRTFDIQGSEELLNSLAKQQLEVELNDIKDAF